MPAQVGTILAGCFVWEERPIGGVASQLAQLTRSYECAERELKRGEGAAKQRRYDNRLRSVGLRRKAKMFKRCDLKIQEVMGDRWSVMQATKELARELG